MLDGSTGTWLLELLMWQGLRLTRVVDALAPGPVEDGHRPADDSRGAKEPALREDWPKNDHIDDGCRVVVGIVWRVDDAAIDDAKIDAPAEADLTHANVHGRKSV